MGRETAPTNTIRGGARLAGLLAAVVLTAIGGLHACWAMGNPWPGKDRGDLTEMVIGSQGDWPAKRGRHGKRNLDVAAVSVPPSDTATWLVAGLLWLGSVILLGRIRLMGFGKPAWVFRVGAYVLTGVFLFRALVGFAGSGVIFARRSTRFARLDAAIYSPLCLVLALLCGIVARNSVPHAE